MTKRIVRQMAHKGNSATREVVRVEPASGASQSLVKSRFVGRGEMAERFNAAVLKTAEP